MSFHVFPPQRGKILDVDYGGYFVLPVGSDADHTAAGKVCSSSGSADTYGTATELIASVAADMYIVAVGCGTDNTTAATYAAVQLVTGASLNVVISTLSGMENCDPPGSLRGLVTWLPYPILVLAGTRLGAQVADNVASARDHRISLVCITKSALKGGIGIASLSIPAISGAGYFTIPAGPAAGTVVASSATANTYGSSVELSASAPNDLYIIGVAAGMADGNTNFYGDVDLRYDASLASSLGKIRVLDSFGTSASSGLYSQVNYLPFPIAIPAGTRLGARTSDARTGAVSWRLRLLCVKQSDLGAA